MPCTTILDISQQEQAQMLAALRRARYGYLCSAIIPSSSLWTLTHAARIIVRDYNLATEGPLDNDTMHTPASPWVASL